MEYLKADVERMCRKHRLHQAELNKRAKQNIPDKEYWAKKRGQAHLNQNNEAIPSTGGKPAETRIQHYCHRKPWQMELSPGAPPAPHHIAAVE
ncbi:MAG: hypothetical protein VZQ97_01430 [Candidatus Onthomonas sp.]|nr:hypothetical protein [Candidatus Onthomonas sp.]